MLELIALAHRYDVKFLLEDCEQFLVDCRKVPFVERFFCAEKFGFSRLQV